MNIDFSERKSEVSYIAMYARGGASQRYTFPTAKAASQNPELFSHVTGAHLAMLEHKGVPVEYATAAFTAGFRVFEVIRLWNDDVPQEYVTAFGVVE